MAANRRKPDSLRSNPNKYKDYRNQWMKKKRLDPSFRKQESNRQREWQLRNPVQSMYRAYTSRSKRKRNAFELSYEQFEKLLLGDCFYCGIEPSSIYKNRGYNKGIVYNGIDRIDSSKGYIKENVVPCCWQCNCAKQSFSVDEFYEWVKRIYKYSVQNQKEKGE